MQAADDIMAAPPPEPVLPTKEYIVTLKNKEDLDAFYEDMETPGGNLYIPDRAVEVAARRTISRNTHYMLTDEEVETVKNDPRVLNVEPAAFLGFRRPNYVIDNGIFNKTDTDNATHINWGLLRCMEESNRSNWGNNGTTSVTDSVSIESSGKNVDVVIIDGLVDPSHPEYAVNADGTGGSRVIQYNWFQHKAELGVGGSTTYVYTPYTGGYGDNDGSGVDDRTEDNCHGAHVAGTVAGNTQGWARDANIYNISPYVTDPNGSTGYSYIFDYVRLFHANKSVNATLGRKNPTVVNCSFGSAIRWNNGDFGPITRIEYRGTDFNPGRSLTTTELQDRGIYTFGTSPVIPYYSTADLVDIQDMIAEGVICVAAAGNEYFKVSESGDQDFNNIFYATYLGTNYSWYLHRGTSPGALSNVICVGAVSNVVDERKAVFSNCGPRVDVYAPGFAIMSSVTTDAAFGGIQDPRDTNYYLTKIQGTSMASPQVCGVIACLLEIYPNLTQIEALEYITINGVLNQMFDSGTDTATDSASLQDAPNRYLLFKRERQLSGSVFPKRNFKTRPTSGSVYPRPRIRAKG